MIFQHRSRNGISLNLSNRLEHRFLAMTFDADAMPLRQETSIRRVLHRLYLVAQLRERFLPDRAQDVGITPFLAGMPGPKLTFEDFACDFQLPQHAVHN